MVVTMKLIFSTNNMSSYLYVSKEKYGSHSVRAVTSVTSYSFWVMIIQEEPPWGQGNMPYMQSLTFSPE